MLYFVILIGSATLCYLCYKLSENFGLEGRLDLERIFIIISAVFLVIEWAVAIREFCILIRG